MTENEKSQCDTIIHAAAVAGAGVASGLAQLPGADNALLVPIEIGMILSLGGVFKIDLTESAAKSILGGYVATMVGRGVSQALFGWIPFIGNALNAATAASVVEMLGWAIVADFSNREKK